MAKCRLGAMGVLPDEMIWEILTWLPTKSLMRFKAVSKLWLSTILDPNFPRAHRVPFRGLLVMNPDPSLALGWSQPTRDFFVANLDDDAINGNKPNEVNFSFQFSISEDLCSFQASNMVNSIICFFSRNVAKLCNIATREIINLPKSKCAYKYCTYHLGFDPIGSVYKLLKICPIYEDEDDEYFEDANDFMEGYFNLGNIECEILTLGVDSSWRSIHPPPNDITPHGLCVDGVLYWMTLVPGMTSPLPARYALYAFNLAGEKFQSIHNPESLGLFRLLQFGASPAIAACAEGRIMITHYRDGFWTEMSKHTIKPSPFGDTLFDIDDLFEINVRGLLPNGNLMLYSYEGVGVGSPIYLFDLKKNYLQEFILRFPASHMPVPLYGRICWYEENIVSLKRLSGF